MDVPTNLLLKPNTMNSTYAAFVWDPVDTSVERVRGFFRGYQVIALMMIFIHHQLVI